MYLLVSLLSFVNKLFEKLVNYSFLLIENYVLFGYVQYGFRSPYLAVVLVADAADANARVEEESSLFG